MACTLRALKMRTLLCFRTSLSDYPPSDPASCRRRTEPQLHQRKKIVPQPSRSTQAGSSFNQWAAGEFSEITAHHEACLFVCLFVLGWLVGWLVGWLIGWLVGWLVDWLAGWLVGWLAGWLLVGWLVSSRPFLIQGVPGGMCHTSGECSLC